MNKKNKWSPAEKIQDLQFFGEYGGVNPSIAIHLLLLISQEKRWKMYLKEHVRMLSILKTY